MCPDLLHTESTALSMMLACILLSFSSELKAAQEPPVLPRQCIEAIQSQLLLLCQCPRGFFVLTVPNAYQHKLACTQGSVMWRARIAWQEGMEDPVNG